jgi:CheY-like chemotaxis protein
MPNAPILIVDDDSDDRDFIIEIWQELQYANELHFFDNGEDVLTFMGKGTTNPFLILCDVNIHKMDGFALKEKLLEDESLNYKSIPFIFWSSQVSTAQVKKAYDLGSNGFFVKENSFQGLKTFLSTVMDYWLKSKVPL